MCRRSLRSCGTRSPSRRLSVWLMVSVNILLTHYRPATGWQVPGFGFVTELSLPLTGGRPPSARRRPPSKGGLSSAPGNVAMGRDVAAGGTDGIGART